MIYFFWLSKEHLIQEHMAKDLPQRRRST